MSERMERESAAGVGVHPVGPVPSRSSWEAVSECKRIRLMVPNQQVIEFEVDNDSTPPLGLKLEKTSVLLDLIERNLSVSQQPRRLDSNPSVKHVAAVTPKTNNGAPNLSVSEKIKASNFQATYLRIGSWECLSRYDGDLVAKCYFAKRKLVWEVLEGGLKSKFEILWSDITSLRTTYREKKPDILEVEIGKLPHFFRETNPQPRKHTMWQSSPDFTRGQATRCRRHLIQFDEGTLERHFEKLLQFDSRLLMLSKAGFPSSPSPYFETNGEVIEGFHEEHEGYRLLGLPQKVATMPYFFNNISNAICRSHVHQAYVNNTSEMNVPNFQQGGFNQFPPVNNLGMTSPNSVTEPSLIEQTGAGEYSDFHSSRSMGHANQFHGNILDEYQSGNVNMSTDMVLADRLSNLSQGHATFCGSRFSENADDDSSDMQLWNIASLLFSDHVSESSANEDPQICPDGNRLNPAPNYTASTPIPSQLDVSSMMYDQMVHQEAANNPYVDGYHLKYQNGNDNGC